MLVFSGQWSTIVPFAASRLPLFLALTLPLLVLGGFTNNINPAKALNDFAFLTNGFDAGSDFHTHAILIYEYIRMILMNY